MLMFKFKKNKFKVCDAMFLTDPFMLFFMKLPQRVRICFALYFLAALGINFMSSSNNLICLATFL